MGSPWHKRLWEKIIPPQPERYREVLPPEVAARRRQQRRVVAAAVICAIVAGLGTWLYSYAASAPERANREYAAGMKLMAQGFYKLAIARFDRPLQIRPDVPEVYLQRGRAKRFTGNLEGAKKDVERALDISPNFVADLNELGFIYLSQNDRQHAAQVMNKAAQTQSSSESHVQLAQLYDSQGDYEKALQNYDLAIAEQTDTLYLYRARAQLKEKIGDKAGAEADRQKAGRLEVRVTDR